MRRLSLSFFLLFTVCAYSFLATSCTWLRSSHSQDQTPVQQQSDGQKEQDDLSYQKESQGDFPLVSTVPRDTTAFLTPRYYQPARTLRIGLLMPFSSQRGEIAAVAQSFHEASQLALMAQRNPDVLLIVEDTGDSPDQAERAAQDVIKKGADVIIGPLLGPSVSKIAPLAHKYAIPIIAFSNDQSVAQRGVYLFSFLPEADVYAIGSYALKKGLKNFAVLAPDNDYGHRNETYFINFMNQNGGTITNVFHYPGDDKRDTKGMTSSDTNLLISAVSDLAKSAKNKPYDAIFIPDGGSSLKTVLPILPYFHIDTNAVHILGTTLFDDPTLASVQGSQGAWFPAVSPDAYQSFFIDYQASYGHLPPKLAGLAYDATNLAISLAQFHQPDGSIPLYLITRRKGFFGTTGMFRFTPQGYTERNLAIMQMTSSGIKVLEPAALTFPGSDESNTFKVGEEATQPKTGYVTS